MNKYWNQTIEKELKHLAEILRSEKMRSVEADETLSPKLKHITLQILMDLQFEFGSTADLKDIPFVESFYEDLNFGIDNFTEISEKILEFKKRNILNEDDNRFIPETFKADAHYFSYRNMVYISLASIINHVYSIDRPTALNYGSLGSVIAHEIIHSTQLAFAHEDSEGLSNEFYTRYECIKSQYDQYVDSKTGLTLNGNLTLLENVADNEGIKLIYNAYKKWQQQNKSLDRNLPYLSFTSNQLFWISFAQKYCNNHNHERTKYLILHDEHTVLPFRINGVVENFSEFSKDFNCPKEAKMNRENKCRV